MASIVFVDSEVSLNNNKAQDFGAISDSGEKFHSAEEPAFAQFVSNYDFLCGHNLIEHDLKYIGKIIEGQAHDYIDTLYVSPLLFPQKPYHNLLKDDKIQSEELNNPLNDSIKVKQLFDDEVDAFQNLPNKLKWIYCALLYKFPKFTGFFKYLNFRPYSLKDYNIREAFAGKICENADIEMLMDTYPVELAYALAIIYCEDKYSITPAWVLKNFPNVENVIRLLTNVPCEEGCKYCADKLNSHKQLKRFFGYEDFRKFEGEDLQKNAVEAAIRGESLLAIFPTGGGKSLTFQLPALISGDVMKGLTVVISPLQSLMKDQVDNLNERGIVDAVTINGLLNPIERAEAIERVDSGLASLLYISPESLRSRSIERILTRRNIARFVIDEAHCFSSWGQDFRVDYLYIGKFIKQLQENKKLSQPIPVSCFTATAKQKVVSDIRDYFSRELGLKLKLYTTNATRDNLRYVVLYAESEKDKEDKLKQIIEAHNCPTIVYVSRTKRTYQLAEMLCSCGFNARPFNGKMDTSEKIANQESFMSNETSIIVATNAFGMGVDKSDVGLVVHYDISDSLENYVQEAGRAGRNENLDAQCYVLYNNSDLDKHFILLNQTKLGINEIQQVWKAIKEKTKNRKKVCSSALEIARQAGLDDSISEVETRVKTAISALETAGYIKRGRNVPRVFASSINVKTMKDAVELIDSSTLFGKEDSELAKRIISRLISSRSTAKAGSNDPETHIDVLSDILGVDKEKIINNINLMKQIGLLEDYEDMTAIITDNDTENRSNLILDRAIKLEKFIFSCVPEEGSGFNLKELNDNAVKAGIPLPSVKNIKTIIYYWIITGMVANTGCVSQNNTEIRPQVSKDRTIKTIERRHDICRFIIDELYKRTKRGVDSSEGKKLIQYSLVELYKLYKDRLSQNVCDTEITLKDIQNALLYLSKIGALILEGGFLVTYNSMEIERLELDNKIQYKKEDYKDFSKFYQHRIQQIHIVGEYANLMVHNYQAALTFVSDYFCMDYDKFINKYFKGREDEINLGITIEQYNKIFKNLSDKQSDIIKDSSSQYIVVAAGPGSGKTRVLVHKLASLLSLEEVKHEQLLMLTFSRAAATNFAKKLRELVGNAVNFVEIRTFHSYCFDLLGRVGDLQSSKNIVQSAADYINNNEVEIGRITKRVLVLDEAQDINESEFNLIQALINKNEGMRVIAVGDDDQNIYEWRGSDSKYMQELLKEPNSIKYEMVENYRSARNIVDLSNAFVNTIENRLKHNIGIPHKQEDGIVQIIHYDSKSMEQPIAEMIAGDKESGTMCVLTNTNDEAFRVLGVLNRYNIPAKLIQSMDGFSLTDLLEMRYFIDNLNNICTTPKITQTHWESAKANFKNKFSSSPNFKICMRILQTFESLMDNNKYLIDFDMFVRESKLEDYCDIEKGVVFVSTIHKSKGKQFDTVHMMLDNVECHADKDRRKLYVGMTRAISNLYIHYNNDIFDDLYCENVEWLRNENNYDEPCEISLQLSHRDVNLGYFCQCQDCIAKLAPGDYISANEHGVYIKNQGKYMDIIRYSKRFNEVLDRLLDKGYKIVQAQIRFLVYWQGKEEKEELLIALPNLVLNKE